MLHSPFLTINITRVDSTKVDIPFPAYATEGSSGMDVCAAVENSLRIMPGETALVPTGFRIELPQGYEAQIRPRSGLAINHGVSVLNSPGTIDSDYRGEVKIVLTNFGGREFTVNRGDRIAQLVIAPVVRAAWSAADRVNETDRGAGGFGHSGI